MMHRPRGHLARLYIRMYCTHVTLLSHYGVAFPYPIMSQRNVGFTYTTNVCSHHYCKIIAVVMGTKICSRTALQYLIKLITFRQLQEIIKQLRIQHLQIHSYTCASSHRRIEWLIMQWIVKHLVH